MQLRNLITFIHVAELGSFTKAAEQLGYSQSTISFQIKQLEEELECLLFERIYRIGRSGKFASNPTICLYTSLYFSSFSSTAGFYQSVINP